MNKLSLFLKASYNVLGVNERNISFTKKYNRGRSRDIADNKYLTHRVLTKAGIPVPKLLAVIKVKEQLEGFSFDSIPNSFVIKPAYGFGGVGNLLIFSKSKKNGMWIGINGMKYSESNLKAYCYAILNNAFALKFAEKKDFVLIQERVKIEPELKRICYSKGLPDIRIVLYKNIPLMAMLRLPTRVSRGKANLHLGGIGVGIDLATGTTTTAVMFDDIIERNPDTGVILSGFNIPHWKDVLKLAAKAVEVVGLDFGAVDVVLYRDKGPLILELNSRPGLSIQIANQEGLKGRIDRVKGLKPKSLLHGIKIGRNLFGGEVEESVTDITGMQVVGFIALANFYGMSDKSVKRVKVKNDSGALYTSIDQDLAKELGFEKALGEFDNLGLSRVFHDRKEALEHKREMAKFVQDHPEIIGLSVVKSGNIISVRPKVNVEIEMEGKKILTPVNIANRSNMVYKAIIGRRALRKNFLVDSNKVFNRYKD